MISLIFDNILGILIAFSAIIFYIKLKNKINYFEDRGMLHVKPTWFHLFNAFSLKNLIDFPLKLYDEKSGEGIPYIGYLSSFKPTMLVLDPKLAESVLIKDFSHFQDHGVEVDFKSNPLMGHLFNMNGDEWRTLRHKLVPTFTSGKLRGMVPLMEKCADDLIMNIKEDSTLRRDTNLKELFKKYSLGVIASCAFGIDSKSIEDPNCDFTRIMTIFLNPSYFSQLKLMVLVSVPFIGRMFKIKQFPQEIEDFFLKFMRDSFEIRKKSNVKVNDFIQLLLELKEKGHVEVDAKDLEQDEKESIEKLKAQTSLSKLELTEELLMAQVFVFLVAGFENTAYLIAITTYVLSKNTNIQKRARQEVEQAKEKHNGINYEALRDMKFLEACIDEALRLYAPVSSLIRQCTKVYTLPDGIEIEKGMSIVLPAKSFHLDSKYWPNPEEFNPDRFLNKENIKPGTYMPFGDGPRICIAQRMATLVAKLMLAKLLENFQLLPSSKNKEQLEVQTITTSDIVGGVWGSFDSIC